MGVGRVFRNRHGARGGRCRPVPRRVAAVAAIMLFVLSLGVAAVTSAATFPTLRFLAGPGGSLFNEASGTFSDDTVGQPITAVADPGYRFVGWSDGVMGARRANVVVSEDTSLTAWFDSNPKGTRLGNDGWVRQVPPTQTAEAFLGVDFVGGNHGWVVGRAGSVLSTQDGGESWMQQSSGVTSTLNCVSFVSTSTGYAVGDEGVILKTDNGGQTWVPQSSGTTKALLDASFPDPRNGWVVGADGAILSTNDGGATWVSRGWQTESDFNAVSAVAPGRAFAVNNGACVMTRDGGLTWTIKEIGSFALYDVQFVSSSLGWAVGNAGTVFRTCDGGMTWATVPTGQYVALRDVHFVHHGGPIRFTPVINGQNTTWTVDVAGWAVGSGGSILRSADGGATWTKVSSGTGKALWAADFADAQTGWVVGDSGTIAFRYRPTYKVEVVAGTGGSVRLSESYVYHGDDVAATITPRPSYHIDDVRVDGISQGAVASLTLHDVTTTHTVSAIFGNVPGTVTRIAGADRYSTAAALARRGWDPSGNRSWTSVRHVIVANGEDGKEPDALSAAGLAGVYDCPVLTISAARVPAATKTVIAEIAKRNPGVRVHIVGGPVSVPEARWNEIAAIPGVDQTKDRIAGLDRYATSAAIAARMASEASRAGRPIEGVILIAGDDARAFYDALAVSPVAFQERMPLLAVKKATIPASAARVLTGPLKGVPRYAASGPGYLGASASGAIRVAYSAERYDAAAEIADYATTQRTDWTLITDAAVVCRLSDALAGGAFVGKRGGVVLFTGANGALQPVTHAFIASHGKEIDAGWVLGGTSSVPAGQESAIRALLR